MNDSKHNTDPQLRRIRSFVRREGRLTPGQQRALDELWPRYGLDFEVTPDWLDRADQSVPLTLEIGFGNGESLAQMAAADPDSRYIGIEVHRPGVGHLLKTLDTQGSHNVRVFCHDAVEVLEQKIADATLDRVLLFFPDPWHKTKHHKRRIVQPDFAALIARKLRPGGYFHLATDWEPYATHMLHTLQACADFRNTSPGGDVVERPGYRPVTKFERRGQRLGHAVFDLIFQRIKTENQ
ncbi:tRNA (guanine-N(7)-)-methyltransferase [Thiogranum longum]|uniref:tRNA (guanine-N(7)-)-methyltransferase n=1 Tax=Thiogranum longum TaxID=1537524 RepID=A0A4R1HBX5_9GAMM|nr:tRNA (guanosine(46)-N7)-methyltransferase TrmB [Thiogranum longum]TCK19504.1 tRNA (guanine-N(7)-)-methyltransferase [Thiogranum longum]